MKATVEWYRAHGIRSIEVQTPHAVSVPGAVDAWCRLHADHATKDLAELMEPAAKLAEEGHAVTPRVAADFASSFPKVMADADAGRVFAPDGRPIGLGETLKQPALAKTLRKIGAGPRRFLRGRGRGRDRRQAAAPRRAAHAGGFRVAALRVCRADRDATIAATTCSNVRRTGRGLRR